MTKGVLYFDIDVEFEDVKFLRATTFTKDTEIEFTIMVQPGTGRFEVSEGMRNFHFVKSIFIHISRLKTRCDSIGDWFHPTVGRSKFDRFRSERR